MSKEKLENKELNKVSGGKMASAKISKPTVKDPLDDMAVAKPSYSDDGTSYIEKCPECGFDARIYLERLKNACPVCGHRFVEVHNE